MRRGSLLNTQFHVTRAIHRSLSTSSYRLGSQGFLRNALFVENRTFIGIYRTKRIKSDDVLFRSFSAIQSPMKKDDKNEEVEKETSVVDAVVADMVAKESTTSEAEKRARKEVNLADLRSPPSYITKTKRILKALPSTVRNASKAFLVWCAQFSKEFIADPRKKLKEIKHILAEGAQHYWVGTKLLIADVKIASAILGRATTGRKLTRREQKQLVRTASDLARLVPMSVFVLIPFMELLLPVALKIFPNMLPSTFEDSLQKEDAMKRELQMRLAMAGFMKDMLREMAKDVAKKGDGSTHTHSAAEVTSFVDKAKLGDMVNEDIFKFAKVFKDDLTLDNMSRTQLVTMCTFMNLQPYGADAFIRFKLRSHIRDIQNDDQRILFEGIDSLDRQELQEACRERGMRALGMSKNQLKRQLQQWLDLSCNRQVPISLLILSRSFALTQGEQELEKAIGQSISALDEEIVTAVVLDVATPEERKSKEIRRLKLEAYEHQEDLILGEKEDREKDEKLKLTKEKLKEEKKAELEAKEAVDVVEEGELSEESEMKSDLLSDEIASKIDEANQAEIKDTIEAIMSPKVSEDVEVKREESEVKKDIVEDKLAVESVKEPSPEESEMKEASLTDSELAALDVFVSVSAVDREKDEIEKIRKSVAEVVQQLQDDDEVFNLEELKEKINEVIDVDPYSTIKTTMKASDSSEEGEHVAAQIEERKNTLLKHLTSLQVQVIPKTEEQMQALKEKEKEMQNKMREVAEEAIMETSVETPLVKELDVEEMAAQEMEIQEEEPAAPRELDMVSSKITSFLNKTLEKLDADIAKVDEYIGDKLHVLDVDQDGLLSEEELTQVLQTMFKYKLTEEEAKGKVRKLMENIDLDLDGVVSVDELRNWLKQQSSKKDVKVHESSVDVASKEKEEILKEIEKAKDNAEEGEVKN